MAAVTLMWEARAAAGRGPELLAWARSRPLDPAPDRRETFRAEPDRVLVLTWWPDGSAPAELPDPPADLLHRPVHRWRFEPVPEDPSPPAD